MGAMDAITLPAGIIDPDGALAAHDPPIGYREINGVPHVDAGMGPTAQAYLDGLDRRPAYRAAAKRALRRHLRENIIGLIAEDDRVVVATAALAFINNRRTRGQALTADMLTIESMAVGLLQDKLAPLKKLLDGETSIDAMTDPRAIYDLVHNPADWPGWTT